MCINSDECTANIIYGNASLTCASAIIFFNPADRYSMPMVFHERNLELGSGLVLNFLWTMNSPSTITITGDMSYDTYDVTVTIIKRK